MAAEIRAVMAAPAFNERNFAGISARARPPGKCVDVDAFENWCLRAREAPGEEAVAAGRAALDELGSLVAARDTAARAVAQQLGYELPAGSTDPDTIQRDIATNMRRSVEACLEVGRGLMVLKEACVHGSFLPRLEAMGLDVDVDVAGRFMNAARKFSNSPTSANFTKAIGNQSKLLELLVLDDEQANELVLTGQTGELKLDDIACMSVKELREALRKTEREKAEDAEAHTRIRQSRDADIAAKQAEIDRLQVSPRARPPSSGKSASAGAIGKGDPCA